MEWATSAIDLGVVVKREAEAKMKTLSIFVVSQSPLTSRVFAGGNSYTR